MKDPHQEHTTSLYNLHALEYKESTKNFIFPGNMFEDFMSKLSGKKILDIGCAYGRDMLRMKEKGCDVSGIEISQNLIKLADASIQENILLGDMVDIENLFSHESFDGIFAAASLLHLDKNIGLKVVSSLFTLLKKGGILFFEAKISPKGETMTQLKESISLPGKYKKYTLFHEQELDNILIKIGFSILTSHVNENSGNIWKIYICKK